jgi:hypothetical protein
MFHYAAAGTVAYNLHRPQDLSALPNPISSSSSSSSAAAAASSSQPTQKHERNEAAGLRRQIHGEVVAGNQDRKRALTAAATAAATEKGDGNDDEEGKNNEQGADFGFQLVAAGARVASRLKAKLQQATGFTTSAGVGSNRLVAKLSAGLHKPNGLTALAPCQNQPFLFSLPIRALHGIGSKTHKKLVAAVSAAAGVGTPPIPQPLRLPDRTNSQQP